MNFLVLFDFVLKINIFCCVNKIKYNQILKDMEKKITQEDLLNIVQVKVGKEASLDSHLTNDLGLDSLDMAELVIQLSDALGSEISDEEAENFHTVQDVWNYIQAQQGE